MQQELLNTVHPSDSLESLVSCHFRKPCLISLYQHKSIVIVLFQMSVEVISEYRQRYKCGSVFTSVCPSKQAMLSASGFILLLKCITIARAVTGGVLWLGVQLPLFLLSITLWHSILPASITLNWMHLILEDKEVQNRHTTEKKWLELQSSMSVSRAITFEQALDPNNQRWQRPHTPIQNCQAGRKEEQKRG